MLHSVMHFGQAKLRLVKEMEHDLLLLLALINSTVSDLLPWLPVIDHRSREVWERLLPSNLNYENKAAQIIFELFNELSLFVHGAVLCAVMTRFPAKKGWDIRGYDSGAKHRVNIAACHVYTVLLNAWYRSAGGVCYLNVDPRCANQDCNKLLPEPTISDTSKPLMSSP